ncbi:MAG: hypothetical protein GTO03_01700, partial [Planctomycetales bacterium]|nr:hypothetical protein [Planctomycetales bacterium]
PDQIPAPGDGPWQATLALLEALQTESFPAALAATLLALASAERAAAVGRHWKLSRQEIAHTTWLVRQG